MKGYWLEDAIDLIYIDAYDDKKTEGVSLAMSNLILHYLQKIRWSWYALIHEIDIEASLLIRNKGKAAPNLNAAQVTPLANLRQLQIVYQK